MDRLHGLGRALDRRFRKLAGMGIAVGLAADRAQAEALRGVEAGALQPPVVVGQGFGLGVFQVEFAVIGAFERIGDRALDSRPVQPGP